MGILAGIFGAPKALAAGVKMIGNTIDDAIFSDEEKAQYQMEMLKQIHDQFAPRAVTRRILAIIIFGNIFLHINAAIVLHFMGKEAGVEFVLSLVKEEMTLGSIVAFFYFGYYGVSKIMQSRKP